MTVIKRFIDGDWTAIAVGQQGPPGPQGIPGVSDPTQVNIGLLANVNTSGQQNGDILVYNSTSGNWTRNVFPIQSTDDVAEGDNLYYTDARVEAIAAPLYAVENVVTDNYTLQLSDVVKVVAFDSASNFTLTVPDNDSVEFPIGTLINVYRAGTGEVDIVGDTGVTVRNVGSISEQFGEVSLRKRDVNEWVLVGQVDEP